jgi:hypothetical protein
VLSGEVKRIVMTLGGETSLVFEGSLGSVGRGGKAE